MLISFKIFNSNKPSLTIDDHLVPVHTILQFIVKSICKKSKFLWHPFVQISLEQNKCEAKRTKLSDSFVQLTITVHLEMSF